MELLYDSHAHLGEESEQIVRETCHIRTLLCAANPQNAVDVMAAAQRFSMLTPTLGLHPWYADQYKVSEMTPFFTQGNIIGEIGMDSVWCNVALDVQQKVFIEQLDFAQAHMRPVILHTKGQEEVIGKIISQYSMPILVHWYSCMEHLELYLERDCYFTIGPDAYKNPAVGQVACRAPLNRLLVETDGLSAVCWALDEIVTPSALPSVLQSSVAYIASAKNISVEAAQHAIEGNFHRFVQ